MSCRRSIIATLNLNIINYIIVIITIFFIVLPYLCKAVILSSRGRNRFSWWRGRVCISWWRRVCCWRRLEICISRNNSRWNDGICILVIIRPSIVVLIRISIVTCMSIIIIVIISVVAIVIITRIIVIICCIARLISIIC